jgi:hypothetical protein
METKEEELTEIVKSLSEKSKELLRNNAHVALLVERGMREQYGLPLNKEPPKPAA